MAQHAAGDFDRALQPKRDHEGAEWGRSDDVARSATSRALQSTRAASEPATATDRSTVYRHAQAFDLVSKRRRNIRAALERIIEKAGEVDVTAGAVVGAIQAYAKINAQGQWVDRSEHVNLNELFERMSREELETYARDGKLPNWFTQTVDATPLDSQEPVND